MIENMIGGIISQDTLMGWYFDLLRASDELTILSLPS